MNPSTGHLMRIREDWGREQMEYLEGQGYEPVPKELAGRDEAMVSLTSGGKLSLWAAKRRKAKRKMAKESKRRNRG